MSEIQIIRGGPYEKQSGLTNVVRPLILAFVYAALIVCVYAPAVYLEAVLLGVVFGPALVALGLLLLLRVSFGGGLTVTRRTLDGGKRLVAGLLIVVGALFIYLRVTPNGWPWSLDVGGGRLWIGAPWFGCSVPASWAALRYGLALTLPLALIPAGVVLLSRILMEIGYPNLADSVRAMAGQLVGGRWLHYPTPATPQSPAQTSNKPLEGGSL